MTRVYPTKGDDANRINFSVPISARIFNRLKRYAKSVGLPPAAVARNLLELNLPVLPEDMEGESK